MAIVLVVAILVVVVTVFAIVAVLVGVILIVVFLVILSLPYIVCGCFGFSFFLFFSMCTLSPSSLFSLSWSCSLDIFLCGLLPVFFQSASLSFVKLAASSILGLLSARHVMKPQVRLLGEGTEMCRTFFGDALMGTTNSAVQSRWHIIIHASSAMKSNESRGLGRPRPSEKNFILTEFLE